MRCSNGSTRFSPPSQGVPAVERALKLLELSAASTAGITLSEVSQALGIAKSSSHRLIYTLLSHGYLQRTRSDRRYSLGTRARDLASMTEADLQLGAFCSKSAEDLSKRVGLTVLTGIKRGSEGVVIFKANSPKDEYPGAWIGHHFDLHCTAMGKALIAHAAAAELKELFERASFAPYTPFTLCSRRDLMADLAGVRARGFSLNAEESAIGGRGLAAPIFNHVGRVVASICVRGSTALFPPSRVSSCAKEVIQAATNISRDLLEAVP
jgi:IclR family KDG regulon transcriptional repressor